MVAGELGPRPPDDERHSGSENGHARPERHPQDGGLPGEPEPDFGSGFGGVDAGLALATGLVVLVVRGTARVVVVRGNARSAVLDGVVGGTVDAVVVGDADASDAVADWLTSLSTARCPPSPAPAATEIDAAR